MKKTLLTLTILILSACANDKNQSSDHALVPMPTPQVQNQQYPPIYQDPRQHQQFPFSYSFQGNNCYTGFKQFQTRQQYCRSLRDERQNNHCAVEARYQYFREYCGGGRRWQR